MKWWISNIAKRLSDWLADLPCPYSSWCSKCETCGKCCFHSQGCSVNAAEAKNAR
jgi:hypothetical protein